MSEARNKYLEFLEIVKQNGHDGHPAMLNYVSELESEKTELKELLSDIAHFTKIESKKTQCYPAWCHRMEDFLKKHGVEI